MVKAEEIQESRHLKHSENSVSVKVISELLKGCALRLRNVTVEALDNSSVISPFLSQWHSLLESYRVKKGTSKKGYQRTEVRAG